MKNSPSKSDGSILDPNFQGESYLSISEAARLLKVSRNSVVEFLPDIPGAARITTRCVRIPMSGIRAWLKMLEVAR